MENTLIGPLTSSPVMPRHPANPVLTARDVPYPATLLFNPGVIKYQGKYVMVFRNDYGDFKESGIFEGTNMGLAFSDDGVRWEVQPKPCFQLSDDARATGGIVRAYDPRLTVIEGRCYMTFAVDTRHGVRGGTAVTEDFETWEILSMTAPDNRNLVLFPERIGGKYVRLDDDDSRGRLRSGARQEWLGGALAEALHDGLDAARFGGSASLCWTLPDAVVGSRSALRGQRRLSQRRHLPVRDGAGGRW